MLGMDILRSSILTTLQEGNIIPGFTKVLNEILNHQELLPLWAKSTYETRRAEVLSEEVKDKFEELETAMFSATSILEIASKSLDDTAFQKLLSDIQEQGINLVEECTEEAHLVGLRGDFGWLPILGANWPG